MPAVDYIANQHEPRYAQAIRHAYGTWGKVISVNAKGKNLLKFGRTIVAACLAGPTGRWR